MKSKKLIINAFATAAVMMMAACGTTKPAVNTTNNPANTVIENTEAARLKFVRSVSDHAVAQKSSSTEKHYSKVEVPSEEGFKRRYCRRFSPYAS